MPKIQINPQTQIRWTNDAVPSGYDIPLDAIPPHAITHNDGGSDEVFLQTSQIQGLDAALALVGTYTHDNENEVITGQWTFTQDTFFPQGITASGILYVDVVQFQAIPRPIDLALGDVYRDQVDNKLYMQTATGVRAFLFMDSPAPGIPRLQLAQALGQIQFNFKLATGQARAHIFRGNFAQAQGKIKGTARVSAQAQTKIRTLVSKHGQARAVVGKARFGFGQAMTEINNHTRVAQAQAQMLQPNFPKQGYSQVQAKLRGTVQQSAQATAWID